MEQVFYCLHDFMLHTKTLTYLLMACGLVAIGFFWRFIFGRDEEIRKY